MSTPATPATTSGGATETHGANTNLDPNMQGGPVTGADRAATHEVNEQNAAQSGPDSTQKPEAP